MSKKNLSIILLLTVLISSTYIYKSKVLNYVESIELYNNNQNISFKDSKRIINILNKLSFYQPLYGIKLPDIFSKRVSQRGDSSKLRATTIEDYLKEDIKLKSLNILDVGSNMGYMDLYFGALGSKTHGIDYNADNIEMSRLIAKINKLQNVKFDVSEFTAEYVENMDYSYDVAFLFSMLHHIIPFKGIEYTQDLMVNLLNKVPLVFVELAIAEEKVDMPWKHSLPKDPLEIFAKCKGCKIELLGHFDSYLSEVKRPLYVVRNTEFEINKKKYSYNDLTFASHKHTNKMLDERNRRYYISDKYFIKEIIANDILSKYACNTIIQFYKNYSEVLSLLNAPKLYDWDQNGERFRFVFELVSGNNLINIMHSLNDEEKIDVLYSAVNQIAILEKSGLYHNDIRLWNFLINNQKDNSLEVRLIDYDTTMPIMLWENPLDSILHFMYSLNSEKVESLGPTLNFSSNNIRDIPNKDFGIFEKISKVIIDNEFKSVNELLLWLEKNKKEYVLNRSFKSLSSKSIPKDKKKNIKFLDQLLYKLSENNIIINIIAWFKFDTKYYLHLYPEISKIKISPFKHYLKFGWKEGKNPNKNFDNNLYVNVYNAFDRNIGELDPLRHSIICNLRSQGCYTTSKDFKKAIPLKNPKYYLALSAFFRDEARFLKEWIEFYKMMGVEHFYLYNNSSKDNYLEILDPYIKEGIVELSDVVMDSKEMQEWNSIQMKGYSDVVDKTKDIVEWMIFVDSDEFTFPVKESNLISVLKKYEDYAALSFSYRDFGTGNVKRIENNNLLTEKIIYGSEVDEKLVSSIVKPRYVKYFSNPHFPVLEKEYSQVNENKEYFYGPYAPYTSMDIIRANHYWGRDLEFFNVHKLSRAHLKSDREKWIKENIKRSSVYDDSILGFVPELRSKVFKEEDQ